MFQLTFPQPAMLEHKDLNVMKEAMQSGLPKTALQSLAERVRESLNPHPAGQKSENVPFDDGEEIPGMQHKYRETVLFFPSEVSPLTRAQSNHLRV